MAESLPERRAGTAWQRGPSAGSLVVTAWGTVVRPGTTFRSLRLRMDGATRWLLGFYLLLATVVPVGMWIGFDARFGRGTSLWYARSTTSIGGLAADANAFSVPRSGITIALGAVIVPVLLLALTWIETLGVRFFGRRRGWRVTKPIAWTVCSHAAVGWAIGGVIHACSPWVVMWLRPVYDLFPPAAGVRIAVELATWAPIAAFFIGMLAFESLVYTGIRACRYANEPRAD